MKNVESLEYESPRYEFLSYVLCVRDQEKLLVRFGTLEDVFSNLNRRTRLILRFKKDIYCFVLFFWLGICGGKEDVCEECNKKTYDNLISALHGRPTGI